MGPAQGHTALVQELGSKSRPCAPETLLHTPTTGPPSSLSLLVVAGDKDSVASQRPGEGFGAAEGWLRVHCPTTKQSEELTAPPPPSRLRDDVTSLCSQQQAVSSAAVRTLVPARWGDQAPRLFPAQGHQAS